MLCLPCKSCGDPVPVNLPTNGRCVACWAEVEHGDLSIALAELQAEAAGIHVQQPTRLTLADLRDMVL